MTFQELSDLIKARHREDYAKLLLTHHDIIIREVGKTTKQNVAIALGTTPQTFSLVYQLILAHVSIIEEIELNQPTKV